MRRDRAIVRSRPRWRVARQWHSMTAVTSRRSLLAVALLAACDGDARPTAVRPGPRSPQSVSVLTQHNDNTRTGWNDSETELTTSNVNLQQFGKLFTLLVDDQVYAQPLVVADVPVAGEARNVVFVATVANTVYAFDGDDGRPYWQRNLTAAGMRPPRNTDMTGACGGGYRDFSGNMGIVGTPVIDTARMRMYVVARSMNGSTYVQHLHALDILTGNEVAGSPVQIAATVSGSGSGSINGVISFDARKQNQRQGLTLVNGTVYVSFASHCDWGPYHGWILGYDAGTLQRTIVYNATPHGDAAGMWESGMGVAADGQGNLYVVTGNGTVGHNGNPSDVTNRGESALKLVPSGNTLQVATFFTPANYEFLNTYDLDYGGMGTLLIPNSAYYLTGDKAGTIYLLDRDAMGGYSAAGNQVHQELHLGASELHCQPAYYKGATEEYVYIWPENHPLRAIPFDRGTSRLDRTREVTSPVPGPTGQSGALLAVSSNGSQPGTAIVWASYASTGDAGHDVSPGILRAFDATDVTRELWNNRQDIARDGAGNYAKFSSPTIANGHVYLATFSNQVVVYGLR